ncbi:MAG TPA: 3-methyl-2-oxobutanoate hydroxymethyltransferase [Elusimicrobia bacterium]|nr:MAG: 3-methyl-2-oxobutanoate hydroxymethyltransferase [Elusimicrobia bacterium GWD2_63_28]HCC48988.1 3-methyl-2-oxobutanoate hydroxymethyltransferase [Elusimicrobiota bacterium]
MKITDFYNYRKPGPKISMVTAYDYTLAALAAESAVDCVLVGDSLAMVMHGEPSTIAATADLMALHTAAVARAVKDKLVVGDMPFLTMRKGLGPAMEAVEKLSRAGAQAVKVEGLDGHGELISHIIQSDIPVMGHIGLTPQSINRLGGYKTQGRDQASAERLVAQAQELQERGCFALVLECVPAGLAGRITGLLKIPVIGIGAGQYTDGQVLVMQDLLGLYPSAPSFVKKYLDGRRLVTEALNNFDGEVKNSIFPAVKRKNDENSERDQSLADAPYGAAVCR